MICFSSWFGSDVLFYNRLLEKHIILLSKCTSRLADKEHISNWFLVRGLMNWLFCLKWDPCELQERREKGVFRAAHPRTPFLGHCPPGEWASMSGWMAWIYYLIFVFYASLYLYILWTHLQVDVCRCFKSVILYYTIPYHTIPYHTIPYHTIPYHTIPYYTILYYTILYYTILYYTILYYTILYFTILYYTILYYTYNLLLLYYTIQYYTILY